jgi:hypothetical protein
MTRFLPFTAGCVAALSVTAAWAQNGALQTNEEILRGLEAAAAAKSAAAVAAEKTRPRVAGYWVPEKAVPALLTIDGKAPPLTAEGRKLYSQRAAARRTGKADDPLDYCTPPGTPRDMLSPGVFMIVQTPAKVTMYHQYHHLIRHVYLDGPLKLNPDEPDPWWQGHSSGWWDGDTLVMESGDFNGKQWLDATGLPQSPGMKVVERFKLTGPDTMEELITIEDSKFYAKPWTTRLTFKRTPAVHLVQDECGEKLLEFPLRVYAPGG